MKVFLTHFNKMKQVSRILPMYIFWLLILILLWKMGEYTMFTGRNNSKSLFLILRKQKVLSDGVKITNNTVVLMWTKFYDFPDSFTMQKIISGREWDPNCCTGENLILTLDRSLLSIATVVVFYNYFRNLDENDLPPTRSPRQLWILFSLEGPGHTKSLRQFPSMFNWTMTYRRDSDIWSPYGFSAPLESPIPPSTPILMPGNIPLTKWISNKTGVLAAVISHCHTHSKREDLVAALKNSSLPVDIYGACGDRPVCHYTNLSCNHTEFWDKLASTYMFYFAGENSLCSDYITEKFWRTLELGMVPLVYGGGDYSAVAPPNSFIDVRKFQSAKHLTAYLKHLIENPLEYQKYFEWRRKYKVVLTDGWGGWCKLCSLAKQYNEAPETMQVSPYKTYNDLAYWWHMSGERLNNSACVEPSFLFQNNPSRKNLS